VSAPKPLPSFSVADRDRFLAKFEAAENGCWEWRGNRTQKGYGFFKARERNLLAPRVAWALLVGNDPGDMLVCHHCDNPPCVRPSHLFLGTATDNSRDMFRKGRANPKAPKGELNGLSKLTDEKVMEIRLMWARGEHTQRELAELAEVSQSLIHLVVSGQKWTHLPVLLATHNHSRKLSAEQVREVRKMLAAGIPQGHIAGEFSVDRSLISKIAHGYRSEANACA